MDLIDSSLLVERLTDCLEDTYESNQNRSLQLLNSIPYETLQDARVCACTLKFLPPVFLSVNFEGSIILNVSKNMKCQGGGVG